MNTILRKKTILTIFLMMGYVFFASIIFAAYHHEGEKDSAKFLEAYPDKAHTKLDQCILCHSGGSYNNNGKNVTLGSCQWCHQVYGYDGSGNILETINPYGKAFHDAGRNATAIKAIENIDSDGDGFSNKYEIDADRFPGNVLDDPTKVPAPFKVFSKTDLKAMPKHTEFLLMNTSRSGDFYAEYSGVPVEELLKQAEILNSATGITVFSPDGWSQYHPLSETEDQTLYPVSFLYPQANYQYDPAAVWCEYTAPSCIGRNHNDPIVIQGGLKLLFAYQREGVDLNVGHLNEDNKLDGEGPYRVVVPQRVPSPPDQLSKNSNPALIWPYENSWDHNAGSSTRTVTMIRIEPLPEGTTDIDILEAGWKYVDEEKVIVYGAIAGGNPPPHSIWDADGNNKWSLADIVLGLQILSGQNKIDNEQ